MFTAQAYYRNNKPITEERGQIPIKIKTVRGAMNRVRLFKWHEKTVYVKLYSHTEAQKDNPKLWRLEGTMNLPTQR